MANSPRTAGGDIEALTVLTGSETRWEILVALFEEPMDFAALREALGAPQSTLNRNLGTLADEGWIREGSDRNYRLTTLGRYFVGRFRPIADVMTVVGQLSSYPDAFPLDEFDFDLDRLADARWRTATRREPYAVINRVRSVLEDSTTVHTFRPYYNPAYIDVTARIASKDDADIVGLVPDHQLEAAVSDADFDLSQFRELSTVEFRVWDGDTDYALAVVDDETVLFTGDHEGGMPSVLVESEDDDVLAWARSEFQAKYDRSEAVTPDE